MQGGDTGWLSENGGALSMEQRARTRRDQERANNQEAREIESGASSWYLWSLPRLPFHSISLDLSTTLGSLFLSHSHSCTRPSCRYPSLAAHPNKTRPLYPPPTLFYHPHLPAPAPPVPPARHLNSDTRLSSRLFTPVALATTSTHNILCQPPPPLLTTSWPPGHVQPHR